MLVMLMTSKNVHTSVNTGHQHIMLTLLLACMLFKALIPQGYMPGDVGAGEGLLVFCGLDLLADSEEPNTDNPHEQIFNSNHINLCLFSSLGNVNFYYASSADILIELLALAPFTGYDPPSHIRKPSFLQFGPRAPPTLS